MTEKTDKIFEIVSEIKKKHGKEDATGEMPCPICGGTIKYAVSKYKGHTFGRCSNVNCFTWRE